MLATNARPEATPITAQALEVTDRDNPQSLYNLLPGSLQTLIDLLPQELLNLPEEDLRPRVRPTLLQERLRVSFWKEYNAAKDRSASAMNINRVSGGLCSRPYFHDVVSDQVKLAWLLCPPVDYLLAVEEAVNYGVEELRKILSLSHIDGEGKINASLIGKKIKILELLDNRLKGIPIQRIEQKSMHAFVHKNDANSDPTAVESLEEIQKRIQALEQKKYSNIQDAELVEVEIMIADRESP